MDASASSVRAHRHYRLAGFQLILPAICALALRPTLGWAEPQPSPPEPSHGRSAARSTPAGDFGSTPAAMVRTLPRAPAGRGAQPNVLFISVDDWNAWLGALNTYPDVITPNVDSLAQRGMLFTRAYVSVPYCHPSRTSMLCGVRASTSGVYDQTGLFRNALLRTVTLPQHFMANGYHTRGASKVFHSEDPVSWHDFFNCTKNPRPPSIPASGVPGLGILDWAAMDVPDTAMGDEGVATWAGAYLAQPHAEPFFLAVGLFRPHVPMYTPQPYFDMYPLESVALPPINDDDLADMPPRGAYFAQQGPSDAIIRGNGLQQEVIQAYLASISFMDVQVGRIIDALENGPNAGNTIVVLHSDNGYHMGQKRHWDKYTLWEESTRVPLIIVAPGVTTPNQQCHRTVSLLDLYPTLIELCGLSPRSGLEGVSLMPLLSDPGSAWDRPAVSTLARNCHAVRSERWRYIRYDDLSEELYDHDADPYEWTNVASNPAYASVKAELAAWMPTVNVAQAAFPPAKLYVKPDATGLNNGRNWQDAFTSLQDALTLAGNATNVVNEIWVAGGTYKPAGPGADRRSTFRMSRDLRIYGGFAGSETTLGQRNVALHTTILSGDLNGDDGPAFADNGDNCYHVITANDYVGAGLLNGFTITGGNADGPSPYNGGGGVYSNLSNPRLVSCRITGNSGIRGGGLYISGSSPPQLLQCVISGNRATDSGGGIFNDNVEPVDINCQYNGISNARPYLQDCIFAGNVAAHDGGAIHNHNSQPRMINCVFSGNTAQDRGGAMYNFQSFMSVVNCSFAYNSANLGGGIYNGAGGSWVGLTNGIMWGNSDSSGTGSAAQFRVQTGQPEVNYSCIQGGWTGLGSHNINADPRWLDPNGPDNVAGTPDDNLRLTFVSPCLDAGNNNVDTDHAQSGVQPLPFTDLEGNPRFTDAPVADTGAGLPPIVDLGPYEGPVGDCNNNGISDVQDLALGTSQDCNSNGLPDECDVTAGAEDCNGNLIPDACEISSGTGPDCNSNGRPDGCDIAGGTSADCNSNAIPDSCDLVSGTSRDCNSTAVPDSCELAGGTSADCNTNSTPDSCDIAAGTSRDCTDNGVPDSCDLAAGTSLDCNSNGFPDSCDIASGTSRDCNLNGVPDTCDVTRGGTPDCNTNGTPDDCDIAEENSTDCNLNEVPDECDIAGGTSMDVDDNGVPDECTGLQGDCNADGEVNVADWSQMAGCLAGPGGLRGVPCVCADLDQDGDTDLPDAAIFQRLAN